MRPTRHARNKLRLYGLRWPEVEEAWAAGVDLAPDADGRPRRALEFHGMTLVAVAALDDPDLVITIYADWR